MKKIVFILICICLMQTSQAQSSSNQTPIDTCGYTWEQDEVVFRFSPKEYKDLNTSYGMWRNMPSIKINSVFVSGEFNNWATNSKDFKMEKQGEEYVFRMRVEKKGSLKRMQFKFVINGKFWVEPKAGCANTIDSGAGWGSKNYILYLK